MADRPLHLPSEVALWPTPRAWKRLDDVCVGVFDCPHSTPPLASSGPFVVRSQDIRTGVFRSDEAARVSEATYHERIARAEPRHGDIFYSREGTYFGIAAEVPRGVRVCLGQRMVLIRPMPDVINSCFLRLWLNSPTLGAHLSGFRDGSVAERLNLPTIRALPVPVVPRHEQDAIANLLGAMDDKIDLNRRMNETLEAMARAVFRDWFVAFGPTRAKMEGRAPYLAPEVWSLFPDAVGDDGLPVTWQTEAIYAFTEVIYGAPFASGRFNTSRNGLPLIRIRDLGTHDPQVFTDEIHPKGERITAGDLVAGMDGEFRLHIWRGPDALLNQRVCKFAPKPGISTAFLAEALREPLAFFERGKVGTTVVHLGKADIDTIRLVKAPASVMQAFGSMADPLIQRIIRNAAESRTLATLRDLLLPRLMSGELRVRDAEAAVEKAA